MDLLLMETYILSFLSLLANSRLIRCNRELVINTVWQCAQQFKIASKRYNYLFSYHS